MPVNLTFPADDCEISPDQNIRDGILTSTVIFQVESCPRDDKSRAASGSGSAGFFGFRQTIPFVAKPRKPATDWFQLKPKVSKAVAG